MLASKLISATGDFRKCGLNVVNGVNDRGQLGGFYSRPQRRIPRDSVQLTEPRLRSSEPRELEDGRVSSPHGPRRPRDPPTPFPFRTEAHTSRTIAFVTRRPRSWGIALATYVALKTMWRSVEYRRYSWRMRVTAQHISHVIETLRNATTEHLVAAPAGRAIRLSNAIEPGSLESVSMSTYSWSA